MSDLQPPPKPTHQRRLDVATKILIACGIGMGIGFGTCGLALLSNNNGDLSSIGAGVFFLCLAGTVITGFVMLVMAIVHAVKR